MSLATAAVGLVVVFGVVAPAGLAGRRLQQSFFPAVGPMRALTVVVLSLTAVIISAEIAGTVGRFDRLGLVVSSIVASLAVVVSTSRIGAAAETPDPPDEHGDADIDPTGAMPRWAVLASLAGVAAVIGQWIAGALVAYRWGVTQFDSLAYHLPIAAHFGQTGSTSELLLIGPDPLQAFHSENVELLDGIGMVAFRSDVVSPVLSLGWLLLALGAAWCLGRRSGAAPLVAAVTALAFSVPVLAATNAGASGTDIASGALLICAATFLVGHGRGSLGPSPALVGLAAGLAVGSKENAVGVALAVLVLTISSAPRGARIRWGATWTIAAAAGGAYWFVRNLVRTGNPLPTLHLGIGPFALPQTELPLIEPFDFRVIDYAADPAVIRSVFAPGFLDAIGAGAVPFALLAGIGILVGLSRPGPARSLSILALAGVGTYLITPYTALGPAGDPARQLFTLNFRYVVASLGLGLAAGAIGLAERLGTSRFRAPHRSGFVAGAVASTTALTVFAPSEFETWQVGLGSGAVSLLAGAFVVAAGAGANRLPPRARLALVAGSAVVALALIPVAGSSYLDRRYGPHVPVDPTIAAFGRSVAGEHIGVTGLQLTYPLYGTRLDNRVTYIGRRLPHGGQSDFVTCGPWRDAVNRSGVDWLVIAQPETSGLTTRPEAATWLDGADHVERVAAAPTTEIYRLDGALDPAECEGR